MAGLRDDLYQRMLAEVLEQAQRADELEYDSISFTEHHFHIEGFEVSTNPVLLDRFVGMRTQRIRVGQLGIVLPAHNPIRVAEDIAMLDQMTGGRALRPGEGLGVLRDVVVADSDAEAFRLWKHGAAFCGKAWFTPFRFGEVLIEPGQDKMPTPEEMLENGLLLVGSVDTVTRQMERLLEQTPVRRLFAWQYNGLIPHEKILRSLELFATKVLPRFAGAPD